MTYAEFIAAIQNLFGIDVTETVDANFNTIMPTAIAFAEGRCQRDLQPISALAVQTATLPAGTDRFTVAADFLAPRQLVRTTGLLRDPLTMRDTRFLDIYAPDTAVRGTVKYWAPHSDTVLRVAPVPLTDTDVELQYLSKPATLSVTNPTTWLSLWAPDLLVAATMVFLAGYSKNYGGGSDAQQQPYWEGQYQSHLAGLKLSEIQKRGFLDTPNAG